MNFLSLGSIFLFLLPSLAYPNGAQLALQGKLSFCFVYSYCSMISSQDRDSHFMISSFNVLIASLLKTWSVSLKSFCVLNFNLNCSQFTGRRASTTYGMFYNCTQLCAKLKSQSSATLVETALWRFF